MKYLWEMDEQAVIQIIRSFIEQKKFPKTCPKCNRVYQDLADYLVNTTHVGPPMSYDANDNDWRPADPQGTLSLATCTCGTTITVDSAGMPLRTLWRLLIWARRESKRRSQTINALLSEFRDKIDREVLAKQHAKS